MALQREKGRCAKAIGKGPLAFGEMFGGADSAGGVLSVERQSEIRERRRE